MMYWNDWRVGVARWRQRPARLWLWGGSALAVGAAASAVLVSGSALALKPVDISPQGEVAQVRQFRVRFDKNAVTAGNSAAPAPYTISCSSGSPDVAVPRHHGSWQNATTWTANFEDDLPPDVRCTAQPVAGFRSPTGEALPAEPVQFKTGAPFVKSVEPYSQIEEDQVFILRFNGAVDAASVQATSRCQVEGIGEQVPVTLVTGDERQAILKSRWFAKKAEQFPDNYVLLRCNRLLPASAAVQLHMGAYRGKGGLVNATPKSMNFSVRSPFEASFSCERPNAQSACVPIKPMVVEFNAPVPTELARQITLTGGKEPIAPSLSDEEARSTAVERVQFTGLAEQTTYQVVMPAGFKDDAGRALRNADSFPLRVQTGATPPLAKFAAAPFGVVERFAESKDGPALLPVTLRKVEGAQGGGTVTDLMPSTDADIIRWYQKVAHYDNDTVSRKRATRDGIRKLPPVWPARDAEGEEIAERVHDAYVESRALSLLEGVAGAQTLKLPESDGASPRPTEVVGIPLQAGFHVVEIASPLLGQGLLSPHYGAQRSMYVRTSALVTNLGVHFKHGREGSLVWVTALDSGKPVPQATVAVSDCKGRQLASGTTDDNGVWAFDGALKGAACPNWFDDEDSSSEDSDAYSDAPLFVSARVSDSKTGSDMAFVWSDWNRGIESWRFQVPTNSDIHPDLRAHTVLDRSLLRAGETVSMKHFIRAKTLKGLAAAPHLPTLARLTHIGSDESTDIALTWRTTATGGQVAESEWSIPKAATLGRYRIELVVKKPGKYGGETTIHSGMLRVEEFRLPTMKGSILPTGTPPLVALNALPVQVQLAYINGGAAANQKVEVSASASTGWLHFGQYSDFSFSRNDRWSQSDSDEEEDSSSTRLLADRLPLKLGADGTGSVTIEGIPSVKEPLDVTLEASYNDANGEVQTLQSRQRIWPAAVVAGIKADDWVSVDKDAKFTALALDTTGKPKEGVKLEVHAVVHTTVTSRKRLVGGFYTYDNQESSKDLGRVCSGKSDARGMLLCNAKLSEPGDVELIVHASDDTGRSTQANTSVTVTRQGEIWWGGEDHDRMDVLPEKRDYQPGDTARFQVRMPFRRATALVTVEREGIIHSEVVRLKGQDPTVELKIQPEWGPNVYVSVLALRGRLREVPWYSFFTWGFKSPREWWYAFRYEGKEYAAPTAMVDLSKPAYRMGLAAISVGVQSKAINVKVEPNRESFKVREKAQVTIRATLPDGSPAAHAEVAVAAVDKALLELMPNKSWDLLHAMYQRRAWGVETSTAQMEIIGRRHYGRKAVAAGGDGGGNGGQTRELFDTLLLWNPHVQLDANGVAQVTVPLNDSLSAFQIVAIADSGLHFFGTGEASIRTTQDLQIINGLPPLVREGDTYRAQITLRNTTSKDMEVEVTPKATMLELQTQTVKIASGGTQEVAWDVTAPAQAAFTRTQSIAWEISAKDKAGSDASDALAFSQRIIPAVPVTVQQASMAQVDGSYSLTMAAPPESLPTPEGKVAQGGVKVTLQPTLADGLPGVRDWFQNYPYTCLEQKASKAVGLRDVESWKTLMGELPTYLDDDGLASYFPPTQGSTARGSDTLTAYLLAMSHEAGSLNAAWQLPQAQRAHMLAGLAKYVEGKIERNHWSPRADRDQRKLSAIEALSRYGKATPAMLGSIQIAPNQWPTHSVIDWYNILQRMPAITDRDTYLEEATQILRSRLTQQGTRMGFSTEQDDNWWWLMQSGDVNGARLILAVLNDASWAPDMGALASGFISRQSNGAWRTTTANLWGGLALEKFAAKFEKAPVAGHTTVALGKASETIDWSTVTHLSDAAAGNTDQRPWFGARPMQGMYVNNHAFLPWAGTAGKADAIRITQKGSGKPWATITALAAVPVTQTHSAGYTVKKTITPVQETQEGTVTRGDIWRVKLDIIATADMTWVAITDPIPAGSTLLGSGLGRDSAIATAGESGSSGRGWLAFVERGFESWRAYYSYLPKGTTSIEYTVRLNNAGTFQMPPTRVEALYAPEIFGVSPNQPVKVMHKP